MAIMRDASRLDAKFSLLAKYRLLALSLGFLTALCMVFFLWQAQNVVSKGEDIYFFAVIGRNVAHGHGFTYHPGSPPTMRRAPLYPFLIALLYACGGEDSLPIQLMQCVFVGFICLLAFEIGRLVFNIRTGLMAAVICSVHPMILRYAPDIQVETTLTLLFTLTLWATVRFNAKPTLANGIVVGISAALASLVKATVLLYLPVFAAYWLVRQCVILRNENRPPVRLLPLAAVFAAMGMIILPWTARNYRVSGGHLILISSNAGGEFLRGYVFAQPKYYLLRLRPYTEGEQEANQMERDLFAAQGLVWERDEIETERVLNKAAKEKLLHDPAGFVRKFAVGILPYWYEVTNLKNSLLVGGFALAGWILALIGWRRSRHEGRETWILFLPLLTLTALHAAILALGRYSAPCIPALVVLAAWGIDSRLPRRAADAPLPAA